MNFGERPRHRKRIGDTRPIDTLASQGHYKQGDSPGEDAHDESDVDGKGNVLRPSATTGESTGTYNEERGPQDLARRTGQSDLGLEGLQVTEIGENVGDDRAGDKADRWLRQNDPDYPKRPGHKA